jgi:preprotein translocase subunit SecG
MEVAQIIVAVLQVIASLVLIAVIMFQSGKESGLSGALSGKNDTYLSKMGGLDKKLASATKWIALGWGVLTLVLCILNAI